jgi:hypothetical protein
MHQEHRCQYGFAFSGLFECDDLEHIVSVGKPLAGLRPSHYAIELQRHGVISLPWMPRRLETKGGGA